MIDRFLNCVVEGTKKPYVILKTGSSTIPWIKNPHDTDYAIFFDDVGDAILAYKNFHKYVDEKPSNNCVMIHTNAINTPKYCWWAYELLFAKVIKGDIGNLYQYRDMKEVLENPTEEIKRHIAKDIHDSFFRVWCYTKHFDENPKILYHVFIWKCLLEKGNLNLTEEEGKMVNDLHDRKFSKEEMDRMKEGFEEFFRQYL